MLTNSFTTCLPLLAAVLAPTVFAQTWTSCNPLNRTDCPPNTALGISNYSIDFTQSEMSKDVWNITNGEITYGENGTEFTINKRLDSPTVQTNFYFFFGQAEVIMKAATGQGIISSIVLQSEDLDEIDWEMMGGNTTHIETNYFGKGNTTVYDGAVYVPIEEPQEIFHNYTVDWSREELHWIVDGNIIRILKFDDAYGGRKYPQTPMNLRLGIWPGGDPKSPNGTIEWAGGLVDYKAGPYTMEVKSVRVSDASTGTQYVYGNTSGTWESIQILNNTKAIKLDGDNSVSPTQAIKKQWNGLSKNARIAIISSAGACIAIGLATCALCCIKQRRAGRKERIIEDAKFEKSAAEVLAYRAEMSRQRAINRIQGASSSGGFSEQRGYQQF